MAQLENRPVVIESDRGRVSPSAVEIKLCRLFFNLSFSRTLNLIVLDRSNIQVMIFSSSFSTATTAILSCLMFRKSLPKMTYDSLKQLSTCDFDFIFLFVS